MATKEVRLAMLEECIFDLKSAAPYMADAHLAMQALIADIGMHHPALDRIKDAIEALRTAQAVVETLNKTAQQVRP